MKLRFPIRFKVMLTLLVVITLVVGAITYTMAALFHKDKTTYIYDLTSVVAQHVAEEAQSLHAGYQTRLKLFARIMLDPGLPQQEKSTLLRELFEDIGEFVAVTLYDDSREQVTVYDARSLERAGLGKADLHAYRETHPLPLDAIRAGEAYIVNSTLNAELPTLTIAMALPHLEGGSANVAAAVVRLDQLLALTRRSAVFDTFLIDTEGRLLAHNDVARVIEYAAGVAVLPSETQHRLQTLAQGQSTATIVEYVNVNGEAVVAGYARARHGALTAAVEVPKSAAYLTARELLDNLVWVALGLLVLAAVFGIVWAQRLTRPIEHLSEAAKVVGQGNFDVRLSVDSRDEIGALADSFNHMATELHDRDEALQTAQVALVQSEKMAAFGQLGAGIAHEIKNPLAGILGYAQLSKRKLDEDSPVYKNIMIIEKETKRCKTIIENLMKFSRRESGHKRPTDINAVIEDAVAIVDHQLGVHRVKLIKTLASDLPKVNIDGNQVQQVLINFFINAQQAMEGRPGEVKVCSTLIDSRFIEVSVSDNGPGIPAGVIDKVFEPFFTTKPVGKGTGLGLSVTFGIIRDHNGELRVESTPGEGASFIFNLPVCEQPDQGAQMNNDKDSNVCSKNP